MTSNCAIHRLEPLDPSVDPAYQDGPLPRSRRPEHAGEIAATWPISCIPALLARQHTISLETLEDALECEARRQERS